MKKRINFRGFNITIWQGDIDVSHEERLEGESWLSMRQRTQPLRDQLEKDYEKAEEDLIELLKES